MGFIVLEATNPDLSYLIRKNPQTAPHVRPMRKGLCIGWFHCDSEKFRYVTRFIDTGENVSFPKHNEDEYDYLPYMQYCAPLLMTCVIREMMGTLINQGSNEEKHDKLCECHLEQAIMKLSNRAIKLISNLNNFITDYSINLTKTNVVGLYKFRLSSQSSSISDLLQYAYIIGYTLNCTTFGYNEKPDSHALDKIIKILNNIKVPYYIRYIFKNCMISAKEFDRVKSKLEGDKNIVMMHGNTQSQRCNFISENVLKFCHECVKNNKNIHIVDIGCGEGYYIKKILKLLANKKIKNVTYHAHDIEESEMKKIFTLIKTDELYSNVKAYNSFDAMINSIGGQSDEMIVIFSEVIEHIPLAEVKNFMKDIISRINFKKMIITTPQYEFNVNYMLKENQFRHSDHKQEFTRAEFELFMKNVLSEIQNNITSEHFIVGDSVNGIGMSQGMILTK